MSELIPFDHTGGAVKEMPAHLAAMFGGEGDGNIGERAQQDQLSIKGKIFRRIVGGEEQALMKTDPDSGEQVPVPVVSLVFLGMNKNRSRAYYEGNYEEGKNAAPRCASNDGITPDASIKEPMCATCANCEMAKKGSKMSDDGKAGYACSTNKRLVVVPAGPGMVEKHPPLLLRIPQTSIWDKENKDEQAKGWYAWDQYVDMLRQRGAKHTASVVTKVKFDANATQPKLLFSAAGWVPPDVAAVVAKRLKDDAPIIEKLLNGSGLNDGLAGTAPTSTGEEDAAPAASAAAEAAKAAEAAAHAEAAKAAKKAADEAAKAEAAAKAAKAAQEAKRKELEAQLAALNGTTATSESAASALGDEAWGGDAGGVTDVQVKNEKPASTTTAAPATSSPPVGEVQGTPAGLDALMRDWDDE